jgi:predicted metalloprotease
MTHEQVRENNRIVARNYRIEVLKMKMKKLKIEPDRRRLWSPKESTKKSLLCV